MNDSLELYMPFEVKMKIAERAKKLRLQKGLKRLTLSARSGVPAGSIKRFESTGDISLSSLLKIASALGCLENFLGLFPFIEPMTMSELEKSEQRSTPKRGKL